MSALAPAQSATLAFPAISHHGAAASVLSESAQLGSSSLLGGGGKLTAASNGATANTSSSTATAGTSVLASLAAASADAAAAAAVSKKEKKGTSTANGDKKKKQPDDKMVLNSKGERVTPREYTLECALEATQKSLDFYKERAESFMKQSEAQTHLLSQQEKDTIEVITYLRLEADRKDEQLRQLHDQIFTIKEKFRKEKISMTEEFDKKVKELEEALSERDAQLKIIQQEFAVVKDFKKKRAQMQKELDHARAEILELERRNKDTISRMEHKFFEEKIRLQKEANRKISELATKAHEEAVANLDETTRAVFQENVRMAEALKYHVQEGEVLSKQNANLTDVNRQLADERGIHDVIVREKIIQVRNQTNEIKVLEDKIVSLEHALSHVVREFEREREMVGLMARRELEEVRTDAAQLKRVLQKKTKEMKYIRKLAQHVLDQRTDLETFFLDALEVVRTEIVKDRQSERKRRRDEYNRQLRAAANRKIGSHGAPMDQSLLDDTRHEDRGEHSPSIRRHEQPHAQSSSPSQKDIVDIHDLTWSQKERVLRLLFARMNGMAVAPSKANDLSQGLAHSGAELDDDQRKHTRDKQAGYRNAESLEEQAEEEEEDAVEEEENSEEEGEENGKEGHRRHHHHHHHHQHHPQGRHHHRQHISHRRQLSSDSQSSGDGANGGNSDGKGAFDDADVNSIEKYLESYRNSSAYQGLSVTNKSSAEVRFNVDNSQDDSEVRGPPAGEKVSFSNIEHQPSSTEAVISVLANSNTVNGTDPSNAPSAIVDETDEKVNLERRGSKSNTSSTESATASSHGQEVGNQKGTMSEANQALALEDHAHDVNILADRSSTDQSQLDGVQKADTESAATVLVVKVPSASHAAAASGSAEETVSIASQRSSPEPDN